MAANNYFGFTHGGTQYSSPAASYQTTGQGGYAAVGHPQTYSSAPARAAGQAGYEGYQGQHGTSATYGFTAGTVASAGRAQDNSAATPATTTYDSTYSTFRPASTSNTYDGTKSYYQQQQQTTQQPATAKVTYSASSSYNNTNRAANNPKGGANNSNYGYGTSSTASTAYPTNYGSGSSNNTAVAAAAAAGNYSGYDAALYSAATMYVQQQQANSSTMTKQANNWNSFKKPGFGMNKMNKPKMPPKPQQLHYCDVCKISCAGPQTYREHLDGQKHKKKEAAAKSGAVVPQSRQVANSLRCELCDVTCTGADAYAAHIRGSKHQKVVKLHTKLGMPIPPAEPTVLGTSPAAAKPAATTSAPATAPVKALVTPKISFIGGTTLNTTGQPGTVEKAAEDPAPATEEVVADESGLDLSKYDDKADVLPVGQDYIEEIKNEEGKVISFQCKLCDCRFNDPNAKEMHMKGRRHRLQYKKKVDPELVVDVKPSLRQRKIQEENVRRQKMKEDSWRRRDEDRWREDMRQVDVPPTVGTLFSNRASQRDHWPAAFDDEVSPLRRMIEEEERLYWEERRRYEEEVEYFEWFRRYGRDPRGIPPPMPRPFPGQSMTSMPNAPMRRPDTVEDRHVQAKHAEIYPNDEGLQAVQKIVSNTEKALKQVSDILAESQASAAAAEGKTLAAGQPDVAVVKQEPSAAATDKKEAEQSEKKDDGPARVLKGVMRVGVLAKGLLLKGDSDVQLVVLCSEKPTMTLLQSVASNLAPQLAKITDEGYTIRVLKTDASLVVSAISEPKINVNITLTSPVVREVGKGEEGGETVTVKDPPDVLDRQKCLDALAALRHAKWFQARASGLQSCVVVIRILRDLCQRVPTWTPLNSWAMELLTEKVLCSAGLPLSPGDGLRRVFEALASGILLPGGPGLLDPCEKDPTDASVGLTQQEREDITASAQHALRLMAFRQIHKVLGMDQLPPPKFPKGRFLRKRRRDNSTSEGVEGEGPDNKKDKKEGDGKADAPATEVVA